MKLANTGRASEIGSQLHKSERLKLRGPDRCMPGTSHRDSKGYTTRHLGINRGNLGSVLIFNGAQHNAARLLQHNRKVFIDEYRSQK